MSRFFPVRIYPGSMLIPFQTNSLFISLYVGVEGMACLRVCFFAMMLRHFRAISPPTKITFILAKSSSSHSTIGDQRMISAGVAVICVLGSFSAEVR